MARVSLTELRQNMADYFDRVISDREPLVVTPRGGKGNVVVMSEAEFEGWRETVHLLSSPKNAMAGGQNDIDTKATLYRSVHAKIRR